MNRKNFGLTWNVALESGGWLAGDEVKIFAEMELIAAEVPAEKEAATVA